jgi:exonuclease III
MAHTYRLATLNINVITNRNKISMFTEFLYKHDFDWLFLQEVTDATINKIPRYISHKNIGSNGRGTAILAKEDSPAYGNTAYPNRPRNIRKIQ